MHRSSRTVRLSFSWRGSKKRESEKGKGKRRDVDMKFKKKIKLFHLSFLISTEGKGIFMLCSMLASPSADIKGHALAALCTLLAICTR
jgi:hypothetical protein